MNWFKRKKYNLPKRMNSVWFAAVIHMEEVKLPPAFDEDGKFIEYSVGDVVPMKVLGDGKYAFYKITKEHYRSGDWLYSSDAYKYDLVFHHVGKLVNKSTD